MLYFSPSSLRFSPNLYRAIFYALLLCLFFLSCKKSYEPVSIEEELPPGYQKDVPWPSLADSPWPKFHGDAQSTGRSKYPGPAMGMVDWSIDSVYSESGVVIGSDSSVYFIGHVFELDKGGLCSYAPNGTLNWIYELDEDEIVANATTPLITANSTIIFSSSLDGKVIAVNPDGTLKWSYNAGEAVQTRGMNIGLDGTIYIVDSYLNLHAISSNGDSLWQLPLETNHLSGFTTSFSPDGSTLYIVGGSKSLYAVDVASRQVKWIFGENGSYAAPVVDSDGNIYLLGKPEELANEERDYLCKINANGNVIWRFFVGNSIGSGLNLAPTIDKLGNIYFAPQAQYDSVYSVNFMGELRWKKALEGKQGSPIVCDINNVVYVPVSLVNLNSKILTYCNNGDLLWQTSDLKGRSGDSPAMGFDILYYNTYRSRNFYAIK